jgi:hypothetical protein
MSGGSMNYLYSRVLYDATFETNTPERIAFRKHLGLVSECLKAIEWNDSGDGDSREEALLLECVGKASIIEAAIEQAKESLAELQAAIARAEGRDE